MANELDLQRYLQEIRRYPLLTAQQEQKLARRIRAGSDDSSRQEMIRSNLRLVVSIARRYARKGVALIDLVAEGNIGLVFAVDRFDPDKNVRFSTYATWWVRQAIQRALTLNTQMIRLPNYMNQRIARMHGESISGRDLNGAAPTDAYIATRMNLNIARVVAARQASDTRYAAAFVQSHDQQQVSVHELLEDANTPAPEAAVEHHELTQVMELTLARLQPREAFILRLRNGIGVSGTFTLDQIAVRLGVTRERVRQIECGAMKKLGHLLKGREYLLERTVLHISRGVRQTVMI